MKIAVIGSGISGLACAHDLARSHSLAVTLFEAGSYLGGHSNTVDIDVDGIRHPVDTGFLVFNHHTYPNLVRLFAELGVPTARSEMSFAVSLGGKIEWAGTNLATVFAQPANLLRPRFLGMLRDIMRFNRAATTAATMPAGSAASLGEVLQRERYSRAFRDWYLLPMAAAIWSCPKSAMLDYPFATFARFCHNHGLLQVKNRPQWHTVRGGSREYVRRMADALDDIRLATPVTRIRRTAAGVLVHSTAQERESIERFDHAVLACHSDQALAMIDEPSVAERSVLGAIGYQPNVAWLHTDRALLPHRERVWAAWNYLSGPPGADGKIDDQPVAVSYLINKLQPVPFKSPVVVTLNPPTPPRDDHVLARFDYAHPVFDQAAVAAQARLSEIQGADRLWFAGAWAGYGFHEDGLKSGLSAAASLAGCISALRREAA
jgi:predicted NAD/FAD-binding protein